VPTTHTDGAHVETCWVASNSLSLSLLLLASRFRANLVHLILPLISSKSRNLFLLLFLLLSTATETRKIDFDPLFSPSFFLSEKYTYFLLMQRGPTVRCP